MAVVVSARQPEIAAPDLARTDARAGVRRVAIGVACIYVLALVATSLERFAVPGTEVELGLQAYSVIALVSVQALAVYAWIAHRDSPTALLAVTVAAVLSPT